MTHPLLRQNLAAAYHIMAHYGLDDLTYTHISARPPGEDSFYIYPFGLLFKEVKATTLLRVTLKGDVLEGKEYQYNQTGYVIHGSIYQHRPDINAIFHLHTPAGVAVSAMECGLVPISQWALHFYNRVSYHPYNALALDADDHSVPLAKDLGNNKILILKNHGTITCGATLHEACFYAYHLEQACKTQCMAMAASTPLTMPSPQICEQAAQDLLAFEQDLGQRDWQAHIRNLDKLGAGYKR